MKRMIFTLLLMIFMTSMVALNVFVDQNRFLDAQQNTLLELTYQIPYEDLSFLQSVDGFSAEFKLTYKILKSDKVLLEDNFLQTITVPNEAKTKGSLQFKDKLALTLSKSGFIIQLNFEDLNSNEFFDWSYEFMILDPEALVSDIELSEQVFTDTTLTDNLRRGNIHFDVAVDHLFFKPDNKDIVMYYEIQNFFADTEGNTDISESIEIFKDEKKLLNLTENIKQAESVIRRLKNIDISELEKGYYKLVLKIKDNLTGFEETKEDFFLINERIQRSVRMFPSLEDEIKLIRYFVSATKIAGWNSKSEEAKKNLVDQFWMTNDPDPSTEVNEFFQEVKNRVDYANDNFSHFEDGWATDRGRIYLKNGAPDEISTTKTGFYTKYAQKDVEIWKYRYSQNLTYLFVDFSTSGSHKLIYNENDDEEDIFPDWLDYLGEEFDENLLQ